MHGAGAGQVDGTAKGGVVVAIRQNVGLPVKYLGVGERAEDLAPFESESFVDAMFEELPRPIRRRAEPPLRDGFCLRRPGGIII